MRQGTLALCLMLAISATAWSQQASTPPSLLDRIARGGSLVGANEAAQAQAQAAQTRAQTAQIQAQTAQIQAQAQTAKQPAVGQTTVTQYEQLLTRGFINGRGWNALGADAVSSVAKITFVKAFFEGRWTMIATMSMCEMAPVSFPVEERPGIAAFCKLAPNSATSELPQGVAIGDAVMAVDAFFSHPENLRFRVLDAIDVFLMRVNGKSQAEIDSAMSSVRAALFEGPPSQK